MVAGPGLVVASICWCRKEVAGSGLVVAGVYWCWKVVAGLRLVVAGAELVAADIYWCGKVLFTNPSARAGYDTRSIFKRSSTGFEFRVFLLLD